MTSEKVEILTRNHLTGLFSSDQLDAAENLQDGFAGLMCGVNCHVANSRPDQIALAHERDFLDSIPPCNPPESPSGYQQSSRPYLWGWLLPGLTKQLPG